MAQFVMKILEFVSRSQRVKYFCAKKIGKLNSSFAHSSLPRLQFRSQNTQQRYTTGRQ